MYRSTRIIFVAVVLFFSKNTNAQNLVVNLNNATTNTFPIASIQSIKFGASTMILQEFNGTVSTWNISDINNYAFSPSGVGVDEHPSSFVNELNIFPNPSSGVVNVQFQTESMSNITVEIISGEGKKLYEMYAGNHEGLQTYTWNSNLVDGVYYCRILLDKKTITKPFIVKQ
jgi:hypothetical protein